MIRFDTAANAYERTEALRQHCAKLFKYLVVQLSSSAPIYPGSASFLGRAASALSTAASLQIGACISNFMILEIYPYFPEQSGYVQVLANSPENRIRKGSVQISAEPGLGATLAAKRVRPFLFAECRT